MCRTRDGFTLIELIIVITVISFLLAGVAIIYVTGIKSWGSESLKVGVKEEARRALDVASEELEAAISITAATATSVTFTEDADGSGVDETYTYTWSGTVGDDLTRTKDGVSNILSRYVESFALSYYDTNDALLSFPVTSANVRRIVINLQVKKEDESVTERASVRPRSL